MYHQEGGGGNSQHSFLWIILLAGIYLHDIHKMRFVQTADIINWGNSNIVLVLVCSRKTCLHASNYYTELYTCPLKQKHRSYLCSSLIPRSPFNTRGGVWWIQYNIFVGPQNFGGTIWLADVAIISRLLGFLTANHVVISADTKTSG